MSSKSSIRIKPVRKKKKEAQLYCSTIITQTVHVSITNIGRNIDNTLKNIISHNIEGKCISEGYIKPESVNLISYSNGVQSGYNIVFEVVIECQTCNPVEGMIIPCIAKNITKAGIRASVNDENDPLVIFIARDHNYLSKAFSDIEENQEIKVRVIGQRYELNDKYISVIGELIEGPKGKTKTPIKLGEDINDESINDESINDESINDESINDELSE